MHTARDKKQALQALLYTDPESSIKAQWEAAIRSLSTQIRPLILGIPSDTGGGIVRGANWGPLFVREALFQEYPLDHACDLGDVRVIPHLLHDKYLNADTIAECRHALFGSTEHSLPVSPLSIAEIVLATLYDELPVSRVFAIGGDHSISYSTVSTYLASKRKRGIRAAIIHFDAHTDLSAMRLGIDINFSTWAHQMLPLLHTPADLIQIGLRASAHDKAYWCQSLGVQQFWSHEITADGTDLVLTQITEYLKSENIQEIYISFDIDALDSQIVSATGTPEPNGLSLDTAIQMIRYLGHEFMLTGADLVEVAPFIGGHSHDTLHAASKIAAELLHAL